MPKESKNIDTSYEVWYVSVDSEGCPTERHHRALITSSYNDAVKAIHDLNARVPPKAGHAYDLARNGRWVSWKPTGTEGF